MRRRHPGRRSERRGLRPRVGRVARGPALDGGARAADAAPRSALRSWLVEERSAVMTASPAIQEIAIITGASTGIGAATARELARRGFHVLAGVPPDRDADAIRGPGIEPLIVASPNPDPIGARRAGVHRDPQGRAVRALVNNAAIAVNAPVEAFAIDEWRRLFEVNLFGHIAITQTLLPALIRSKGRVVNISSVGGKIAMATYGPYAGTKFALEAVSDSLRREIAPFDVQVVVVEPGAVCTEMAGRAIATAHELASTMTPEQSQR